MSTTTKLPAGTRGFDCNTTLTSDTCKTMRDAGLQFAVRYVRRTTAHGFDITLTELETILASGLKLMLVQHVAPPGWMPTESLGKSYGENAVDHAKAVGYISGAHLWCDLEGVARSAQPLDVRGFCNAWYDVVKAAGYVPGLYVGDSAGLNPQQLYALRFTAYWGAYNLNRDAVPAVRGVMMQQRPYPKESDRAAVRFEYDLDEIRVDAKGDTPILMTR